MGKKAGALLWNRRLLTANDIPPFVVTNIDTGLAQPNQGFGDYSPGEPALDKVGSIGSRIQVIPMAPVAAWASISHGEPYVDADGKIIVDLTNTSQVDVLINVLFWDPHSMVGPGDAAKYGGMPDVPQGPPPWA